MKGSTDSFKCTGIDEHEGVMKAAQYYVNSLKTGDIELARQGFKKDAMMHGWLDKSLSSGPIHTFFDMLAKYGGTPELGTHIHVLSITPTTAIVEVDFKSEGETYRDHLAMVKTGAAWEIVTKLFHVYED